MKEDREALAALEGKHLVAAGTKDQPGNKDSWTSSKSSFLWRVHRGIKNQSYQLPVIDHLQRTMWD